MRMVRVEHEGRNYVGILKKREVILHPDPELDPLKTLTFKGWTALRSEVSLSRSVEDVRLLPPVNRPGKIIGVGLNYGDHAQEQGLDPPEEPILFPINSSAVVGPGEPILLHPQLTSKVDYEAELAVVIGMPTRDVSPEKALDHVAGYTAINDVSARDLQRQERHWIRAKGLDGFAPLGPALVSPDSIDPSETPIQCFVNGELRQDSSTKHLVFSIPELISYCSRGLTLHTGDIIATGTPGGVGFVMDPPRYLCTGDTVTVRIPGIGDLVNPVSG